MFFKRFGLFILFMLFSKVYAVESLNFGIQHSYQSPRALGMGDAFVAVADDYSGLFYNPAGLARREDGEINLALEGAFSASFFSFLEDISEASSVQGTDAEKQAAIQNVINNVYGTQYMFRFAPFTGVWVRPHWGLGIIPFDATTRLTMHKYAGPGFQTTFYGDSTVQYGYGTDVKGLQTGRLSVGMGLKFVNRAYINKAVIAADLAVDSNVVKDTDFMEGYTVDADLGALWTPLIPGEGWWQVLKLAKPTFGLVVRNVAETGFGQSMKLFSKNTNQAEAPEKLYRVVDIGTRWEYPSAWIFGGRGTMDFRDILHPNYSLKKGLHIGFEFDWRMTSWWKGQYRFGWNQGYYTAGLSALFTVFSLDLVTYSEDVGTFDTPQENRVYMMKMNINI